MNALYLTTRGACPSFLFIFNETSYAKLLHVYEIVDHTHTVLGSIALIQVIQPAAREIITTEAVPDFILLSLLTGLDPAGDAGFRFDAVVAPATGACILISCIGDTEAAVHSARRNQRGPDGVCLF